MRNILPRLAACAAVLMIHTAFASPDITGFAALTSDYVFRGVSQSDEHAAVQLGIDAEFDSGWFVGVWGSTTNITTGNRQRDKEVDIYLGYVHDFARKWSVGFTFNRYTYPGADPGVDYDYNDIAATANYNDRLWLEFSYTDAIFGHDSPARNIELTTRWPLGAALYLGFGGGYFDLSDFAGTGYGYWQIGLTRPFDRISLDLRYHDSSRALPGVAASDNADARLVFSISAAF